MIFYIRLVHPSPQAKQRNVTGKLIQAGLHRFFGFCRAGGYGAQNAFQGRHTGKTGGFQRGPKPPLWHTTLLARCSVLYLPARLTGEKWRAMRFVSRLDRQKNGWRGCVLECARMTAGFAERGQGYRCTCGQKHNSATSLIDLMFFAYVP